MQKIIVIGLDGASFDFLDGWMEKGFLPNLKFLCDNGARAVLQSVIHPISPSAWASMLTGVNPGKHGVYDWRYKGKYLSSLDIKAPRLWEYAEKEGITCGIMNVPLSFPPQKINGYMITGMLTPSLKSDFTYPKELKHEILTKFGDYQVIPRQVFRKGSEDKFLKDLLQMTKNHKNIIRYLLKNHKKDINFFVFMTTDFAQHKFWKEMEEGGKYKDAILQIYKEIDKFLGELLTEYQDDLFFIVSDHGAGRYLKEVNINQILMREGLLKLKDDLTTNIKVFIAYTGIIMKIYRFLNKLGLGNLAMLIPKKKRQDIIDSFISPQDIDWKRTYAYAEGYLGKIFINKEKVKGKDYKKLREKIKEILLNIKDPETGEKVTDKVYFKEELYWGPYLEEAPDIIFIMKNYSYVQSEEIGIGVKELFKNSPYEDTGQHRLNGIFVAYKPGVIEEGKVLEKITIMDVMPTLLYAAGAPIPEGIDGKPVLDAFTQEFKEKNPVRYKDYGLKPEFKEEKVFTKEEEAGIKEMLKNLGYITDGGGIKI